MAIEQSPAFSFYVKEWRSSRAVQRMTFAQRGMYLEMLLEQWENLSLPDCPLECAHLIGGTDQEWVENWPVLRRKFVDRRAKGRPMQGEPVAVGRIWNLRLEAVRRDRRSFRIKARNGGIKRALSAKRDNKGTYLPASEPADVQQESSIATATAIATAIASPTAKEIREEGGASPAVMEFPTQGKPSTWTLRQADIDEWSQAYPHVDVKAECAKALVWIRANKPKTAGGMGRFLVNWLGRTVDRGGRVLPMQATGTDGRGRTGAAPVGKYDGIEEQD
jgi:hypothetical protein